MNVSSLCWLSHLLVSNSSYFSRSARRSISMSSTTKKRGAGAGSSSSSSGAAPNNQKPLAAFFQPASSKKKRARKEEEESPSLENSNKDHPALSSYKIFCDLDGVLVDFDAGVARLLNGRKPDQVSAGLLWSTIHATPHFYRDLPWTTDGETLWEFLRKQQNHDLAHPITILTGVSQRSGTVVHDKYQWCQRELCVETNLVDMTGPPGSGKKHLLSKSGMKRKPDVVNVVTCWSRNKHCESKPGHVLIDDRDKLRADWEKAGGIFIYHTNTASTVQQLRSLGIVPPSEESAPTPSLSLSSSDPPSGAASTAPVRETAFNAGTVETNKEER